MRLYERLWRGTWAVVAILGVAVGLLEWSALGVLLTLVPLVLLCWLVQQVLSELVPGSLPWRASLGGLRKSLTATVGILAVCSFGGVSPPLGVFVLLTAGVSSPAVVRRALRSARGPDAVDPDPLPTAPPRQAPEPEDVPAAESLLTLPEGRGPLNGLDDRQLCRLWRDSFWLVRQPSSPGVIMCRVALREACLDELERRDAHALQAWLDSGARASSGPEKYLAHPARRDPP